MIGWLIYDEKGAKRNEWFINELILEGKKLGIEIVLKIFSKSLNEFKKPLPDFVIVRVIEPKVNAFFEKRNIQSFNNYKTSLIANSKWNTFKTCEKLNIQTMKTLLINKNSKRKLDFPFVVKSLDGHGGEEVFLIKNQKEFSSFNFEKEKYICQEFCSCPGKDMRVYVLGGKIIAGILRTSKTDFRSNFSLGGSVKKTRVNKEQKSQIKKIYEHLKFDFVGIDFIYHNKKWVLNEIEDVVGSRMLYKTTGLNVASIYIKNISKKVIKNDKQGWKMLKKLKKMLKTKWKHLTF